MLYLEKVVNIAFKTEVLILSLFKSLILIFLLLLLIYLIDLNSLTRIY
jgi:hypothetical protein